MNNGCVENCNCEKNCSLDCCDHVCSEGHHDNDHEYSEKHCNDELPKEKKFEETQIENKHIFSGDITAKIQMGITLNILATLMFSSHPKADCWSDSNPVTANEISLYSHTTYNFYCKKGKHYFESTPYNVFVGTWCCCYIRKVCDKFDCTECYDRSFASYEKAVNWHPINQVPARFVTKKSVNKYYFKCNKCPHTFEQAPREMCYGIGCPYCSHTKLCNDVNCKMCFDNSLMSVNLLYQWSSLNTKTPRDIFKNSHELYHFICKCTHSIFDSPHELAKRRNEGTCSFCDGYDLCDDENCKMCFDKSFASCPLSKDWSKDNNVSPRSILRCSNIEYLFDCRECKHQSSKSLNSASQGNGCKYCAHSVLCDDWNCEFCFNNSFASYEKSKFWIMEKNGTHPRFVFKYAEAKYSFLCELCQEEYIAAPGTVSKGCWCNCEKNKTEKKLYEFLQEKFSKFQIEREKKFDWCKSYKNRPLPFDFYIEELKIIIELDGNQHFKQVLYWDAPEIIQERDKFKMKFALDQGYIIIRIHQVDVYSDKNNWRNNLLNAIKSYEKPTVILIGDIYEKYPVFNEFVQ